MKNKLPIIFAVILMAIMITLAIISLRQESAIMDEVAHIPAGYSYLTQRDYRLNPEHPPLLKDLSAVPLLFMKGINFPSQLSSWQNGVNNQWDFGFNFLYNSNNNADKIIFWSRLPMLLLLILLGFFIYKWTKKLYGPWIAVIAIALFAFDPTFTAHGRYVTTDVGAAFAFFSAIYFFINWIKKPVLKNLILAGVFFGLAQMIKFSLFLLVPCFGLILIVWLIIRTSTPDEWKSDFKRFLVLCRFYIPRFILILIIGYLLIYPVYLFHISNYPYEKQLSDTTFLASKFPVKPVGQLLIWMAKQPILRPYAQYTLGLFMVLQRATGGNTTFFLGDVTNKGWRSYFPIIYILKTPLALHILTIIALLFLAWQIPKTSKFIKKQKFSKLIIKKFQEWKSKVGNLFRNYFTEIAMLIFVIVYWTASITSNLNIGVRHVLPTFPFIFILVSGQIKRIFDYLKKKNKKMATGIWSLIFGFLLLWYISSSVSVFPYYLTYFSELIGGAKNGYIYATDSNLDWGQDLKRLTKWTDENNISKIKVDYFGGATAQYYLKDKYEEWHAEYDPAKAKGSWLAISATFLQQNRATPTKGFEFKTDNYLWLNQYEPITVIGNSIFVYYIP